MGLQADATTSVESTEVIRMVDLFAGCGGLSLGFGLFRGRLAFDEVLAVDNDDAVVRCFNDNHPNKFSEVARIADVNWFSHPSEVLLYYLLHFARLKQDEELKSALRKLGAVKFLVQIQGIDSQFQTELAELMSTDSYTQDWSDVDSEVSRLAITRSFLDRLGVISLQRSGISRNGLLWEDEYRSLAGVARHPEVTSEEIYPVLLQNACQVWESETAKLADASHRDGHGQHVVVNSRLQTLCRFLDGRSGKALREVWTRWRSHRDSAKAHFCLSIEADLRELYDDGRDVAIVIGGPPCKGFSRIARPVMASLRQQGASAWTSHEYGDERNALMNQYILFLRAFKPRAFLFENVSNFVSALKTPKGQLDPAAALAEGIDALSDHSLHYRVRSQVIHSSDHAVPQERDRYIMIGINARVPGAAKAAKEFFVFPPYDRTVPLGIALQGLGPAHEFNWGSGNSRENPATSTESPAYTLLDPSYPASWNRYISWVRHPHSAQSTAVTDAHIYRGLRRDDAALLELFGPGQRWMDYEVKNAKTLTDLRDILAKVAKFVQVEQRSELPDLGTLRELLSRLDANLALRLLLEETEASLGEQHLLLPHYMKNGTNNHGDWLERLSAVRPSKTIIAHIGKDTYSYMHPHEARAITMREAARIQSFPDFFKFRTTGIVEGYAMIGNAVPPLLANDFAIRLAELHDMYRIFSTALVETASDATSGSSGWEAHAAYPEPLPFAI